MVQLNTSHLMYTLMYINIVIVQANNLLVVDSVPIKKKTQSTPPLHLVDIFDFVMILYIFVHYKYREKGQ